MDRPQPRPREAHREQLERRRRGGALDLDELLSLLDAATQLDRTRHSARTLERAGFVRELRDDAGLKWKAIGKRLNLAPSTAFYLYGCRETDPDRTTVGRRRAVIATLALAGPRATELCQLDNQHVDLSKGRLFVQDSKTEAGIRDVDIYGRLRSELQLYRMQFGATGMDEPAFPTAAGTRRNKDNLRLRVVDTVVRRANELRVGRGQTPIHLHVTPHTFRRTYITYMLAAGHDIPYVQSQVGHRDPTVTLAVYAQLIRRPDREQLRTEFRSFLETQLAEVDSPTASGEPQTAQTDRRQLPTGQIDGLRRVIKAGKGMRIDR
jgi:integrase